MFVYVITARRSGSNVWHNFVLQADAPKLITEIISDYEKRDGIKFDKVYKMLCFESGHPIQFIGCEEIDGVPHGQSAFTEIRGTDEPDVTV